MPTSIDIRLHVQTVPHTPSNAYVKQNVKLEEIKAGIVGLISERVAQLIGTTVTRPPRIALNSVHVLER